FAINSRDDIRTERGGAGKFDIIVEIFRPTCGDDLCEEGEIGYCAEDCDWCGDSECNVNETCSSCSKDCGFCAGDIEAIESRTKEYFDLLQNNDFIALVDISSGKFQEYYDEFKRFEREFEKSIDMLGIDKENELLPTFEFTDVDVKIDEMRDNDAIVNASVDDKLYQFKLGKEDGEWKLKDMRDLDEEKWFTADLNLKSLRDNHNDYLGRITEDEGMTPEDIKIDVTTTKAPLKLVIITVVIILIFFGAIFFIFAVIKKRKIFNLSALKKLKFPKGSKKKKKDKEEKEEKEEINIVKKEKKSEKAEKLDISIGGEGKCPKCNAEVFAHERFCVKCGTKLKKKR
ncbi:zinc ribbon domain-containing protein, partial [Candidatus Woesearchaeota archaeon]|nr:zinc ribbon domain-containing protein [Candidatus Woesearchaeota archaeon]